MNIKCVRGFDRSTRHAWTVVHDPDFTLTVEQICAFALEECKNTLTADEEPW